MNSVAESREVVSFVADTKGNQEKIIIFHPPTEQIIKYMRFVI